MRPVCKSDQNQRILYNGHKRVHGIKFRSIVSPNGLIASLFGPVESMHALRVPLQGPFKGANLTPAEQQFNKAMSQVRVSVEWLFGDIVNYAFLDVKKKT